MANKKNQMVEPEVNIGEALSKVELFFNNNKKKIAYILGIIVAIILLFVCYREFIAKPKHKEAQNQMIVPERYFRLDSFALALKGDGNFLGFEDIIKDFGSKADQAVYFYAGVCEFQLGNYDQAIKYFNKYSTTDSNLKARAKACIGDSYVNKEEISTAVGYFEEAAKISDNIFSADYLKKAADCYVELKQYEKALKAYQTIKDTYRESPVAMDIDKYISRTESLMKSK